MAQGGYNIPVSIAPASSQTAGANQNTGVTYNFNSMGATGATYRNEFNPYVPTTATASAALAENGNANSQASAQVGGLNQNDFAKYALIGGGILGLGIAIGLAVYLSRK